MFTTSRYASVETRKLARKLAGKNKDSYVSRGKHTIAELAAIARKKGERNIVIIEERGGKAALIATVEVNEKGEWKWAEEKPLDD